jgi:methylase of polypeptide subunit release factors
MSLLHEQHMAIVDSAAEYIDVEGLRILAPRGVYHPHKWSSTRFLLSALPEVHGLAPCKGLDVLEIGGGSGALALAIKQRGANRVVATDISDRACAAMECNALLNHLDLDVRQGDMFAPLQEGERFDLVIFNLPLMDKPIVTPAEVALCDSAGELLTRFLQGLPEVVKFEGGALFTHANISAPLPSGIPGRIQPVAETRRVGTLQGDDCEIFRVLWWRP